MIQSFELLLSRNTAALMSIPGPMDAKLGEIDNAAGGILVQLSTMRHPNPEDLPGMRERLRERLQDYVNLVMDTARGR